MDNLLSATWPVGKVFDLKVKVVDDIGPLNLIGALNNREEYKFVEGIELQAVGFNTQINKNQELCKTLYDLLQKFESGDWDSMEDIKQILISEINNCYKGD